MNDYNEFYKYFIEELERRKNEFPEWFDIPNHQDGRPYLGYKAGVSGVKYYTEYTSGGYAQGYTGFIVGIYIDGDNYINKYHYLKQFENIISNELDVELHWIDTGRAGRIFFRLDEDFSAREKWNKIIKWQIDKLKVTIDLFYDHIGNINSRTIVETDISKEILLETIIEFENSDFSNESKNRYFTINESAYILPIKHIVLEAFRKIGINKNLTTNTAEPYLKQFFNSYKAIDINYVNAALPLYQEIALKLISYRDNRSGLLDLMDDMIENGLMTVSVNDKGVDGTKKLQDIDPFTFYSNFNRSLRPKNRANILKYLKEDWELKEKIPTFDPRIPWMQNQSAWFFTWEKDRKNDDIDMLWKLFIEVLNENINAATFDRCLKIKKVDNNLSFGLFWLNSDQYISLDASTKEYLQSKLSNYSGQNLSELKFDGYMRLLDMIKETLSDESFYKIVSNKNRVVNPIVNNDHREQINQKDNFMSLNTILYGPPGTGKTYHTVNKALETIDPVFYENNKNNRTALNEKFKEYKKSGQIVFITFHQSYGYEEFIEGIRANTNNNAISYSIENGAFKLISDKALKNYKNHKNFLTIDNHEKQINIDLLLNDFSNFVSEELEEGNKVSITSDASMHNQTLLGSVNKSADGSFRSFYTTGSVNNQSLTKSIIVRDFQDYVNGEIVSYKDIKPRYESQSSHHGNAIYYYELYTKLKDYLEQDEAKYTLRTDEVKLKSFVLIIDEINRGNISKIFGELITLIESDKRYGSDEAASIQLPYSQEPFTVPSNLHLVGTMNTADRSIALLDTALRRRFEFIEMMPKHTLDDISTSVEDTGVNLQEILKVINERIEYLYDRDHTIGHAYFVDVNTVAKLDEVMRNKIIPLLQEYFYDDWEKIQIVLGDHYMQLGSTKDADSFNDEINKLRFVQSERKREKNVLGFNHEDIEDEQVGYQINITFDEKAYKKIYEPIDLPNA